MDLSYEDITRSKHHQCFSLFLCLQNAIDGIKHVSKELVLYAMTSQGIVLHQLNKQLEICMPMQK
jgi:hypothetical protein